jgi:regulation of enolase protein 1 (concanavalin A-like superfamily)
MLRTKVLCIATILLAAIVLVLASGLPFGASPGREGGRLMAAPVPKTKAEDRFHFRAFEGFDGKLHLNWKPVRPDPTHVSLTKHPGKLTITTQRGTIHGDEKAAGEPSAKNLYLIDNPLAKDSDFVMTTCISSFTPTESYQQAGLLCYDDDDNYLKWSYEFDWGKREGQRFICVRETAAKAEHFPAESVSGLKKVWMRLTKHGKSYEYATSTDGKEFTAHGTIDWGDGAPKKLGIVAKNGGPDGVPELEACFEFFELRSPVGE